MAGFIVVGMWCRKVREVKVYSQTSREKCNAYVQRRGLCRCLDVSARSCCVAAVCKLTQLSDPVSPQIANAVTSQL